VKDLLDEIVGSILTAARSRGPAYANAELLRAHLGDRQP
jgi:hypothetical protein